MKLMNQKIENSYLRKPLFSGILLIGIFPSYALSPVSGKIKAFCPRQAGLDEIIARKRASKGWESVGLNDYKWTKSGVLTRGISGCVGVVLIDEEGEEAFMGHFFPSCFNPLPIGTNEPNVFKAAIENIKERKIRNGKQYFVYFFGNGEDVFGSMEQTDRILAEAMEELGITKIFDFRTEDPFLTIKVLALDLKAGEFLYAIEKQEAENPFSNREEGVSS